MMNSPPPQSSPLGQGVTAQLKRPLSAISSLLERPGRPKPGVLRLGRGQADVCERNHGDMPKHDNWVRAYCGEGYVLEPPG
jgi:hypothetical protein